MLFDNTEPTDQAKMMGEKLADLIYKDNHLNDFDTLTLTWAELATMLAVVYNIGQEGKDVDFVI